MELVRLTRQIDKGECSLRNALTNKPVGLVLLAGQVGTVIESRVRQPWARSMRLARCTQGFGAGISS
jgi:hypothetical protein